MSPAEMTMDFAETRERAAITPVLWSVRAADSVMRRRIPFQWHYEHGLMLKAIEQVWIRKGESKYYGLLEESLSPMVDEQGCIRTYSIGEYNLDQINPGRILFTLYQETRDAKYRRALFLLREQLRQQPRTRDRGFWHKNIYPHQMWLDGIYMGCPFYAEFGRTFDEPEDFDDVALQIRLANEHLRDPIKGLLYHAWDESRTQPWANLETGCSPHFWGRAMGWYTMAIVDALDYMPLDHPQVAAIVAILEKASSALLKVQDAKTGLWSQVLDQGQRPGNYLETSASCMLAYSFAKGVRKGYLGAPFLEAARAAYSGVITHMIEMGGDGQVNVNGICGVAGLGGEPYRDGSYDYYVGEPIIRNDYKGVAPFILASLEMESL